MASMTASIFEASSRAAGATALRGKRVTSCSGIGSRTAACVAIDLDRPGSVESLARSDSKALLYDASSAISRRINVLSRPV